MTLLPIRERSIKDYRNMMYEYDIPTKWLLSELKNLNMSDERRDRAYLEIKAAELLYEYTYE